MIISCNPRGKFLERAVRPQPTWKLKLRSGASRMTIGIGMLCARGAVIAADTKMANETGATYFAEKVRVARSTNGAFVAAFAASDVNAARTLLDDLFEDLVAGDPATIREVEELVRPRMARWVAAYTRHLPEIELILGVSVRAPWVPERNLRGGVGLYFCQPPNTMLLKDFLESDPSTYVGIGGGAFVTDPIFSHFFRSMTHPKAALKQIAYMMYRAKRDHGAYCGGRTNSVFLRETDPAAFEILPVYMDRAENVGAMLEHVFSIASDAALSPTIERAEEHCDHLRSYLGLMRGSRELRFLTQFNQEICEDGIVRQLAPEK